MTKSTFRAGLAPLAGLLFALGVAQVEAETTNCTVIDALPYTITTPGVYCLIADFFDVNLNAGAAITIDSSDVVLDMNGHKVGNGAGNLTQASGIYALNRTHLTVRNGTLIGFLIGVNLKDNTGGYATVQSCIVEDMRANFNKYQGINVEGKMNVVRNNHVLYTYGTTVFGANISAYGIRVVGHSPRVLNNEVSEVFKSGTGVAYGIFLASVTNGFVYENRVAVVTNGIVFFGGSTGKYKDSLTSGVTTAFSGGTDAGGNN